MTVGVPVAACGGQVHVDGGRDAGPGTSTATGTATQPVGSSTSTGTATSTATGSATSAPACSSSGAFGGFPCTAYTAWYYSCPPIAGTSGCVYPVPVTSGNPADGWTNSATQSQPPGAQLEIVYPTDVGGSTCGVLAHCSCDSSAQWVSEINGNVCPN